MTPVGLPHSEIPGSKRACRSPRHIAACHVLHRLSVPRHPPSTLSNLTIKCLDLMRSAVPHTKKHACFKCISIYLPIDSIVKETARSRRPAVSPIPWIAHTARLRGLCRCGSHLTTWKGMGVQCRSHGVLVEGNGGAGRDRTDDPLVANQVLSRLSYSPFGTVNRER